MARKPNVSATSRAATAYSEYTGRYRQSENIEDRRKGLAPSQAAEIARKPNSNDSYDSEEDASFGGFDKIPQLPSSSDKTPQGRERDYTDTVSNNRGWTRTSFGDRRAQDSTTTPDSTARKVDPEEAIQVTHRDRK